MDEYEYEDPHIVAGFDQMRMFQTPKTSYGSDAGQNKVPTKKNKLQGKARKYSRVFERY